MTKAWCWGVLVALSLPQLHAEDEIEFSRHIPSVRGVEIIDAQGELALADEAFSDGRPITFRLFTNSDTHSETVFIGSDVSYGSLTMKPDVELQVNGGKIIRNKDEIELFEGVHTVQARIDATHHQLTSGLVKVKTFIELR
ncbi:hypothetical protein [Vibrio nomapromontoriensis]|uniref:hypothetical protein n=1 Tax=Vibrio nomapromontoriensis TaxID=2910246 RepID=UPI003D0A0882